MLVCNMHFNSPCTWQIAKSEAIWVEERGEDLFVSGVSLAAGENKWGPFLKSKQVNSQNLHSPSNFPNIYCKNLVKLLKVLVKLTLLKKWHKLIKNLSLLQKKKWIIYEGIIKWFIIYLQYFWISPNF